MAKVAVIGVGYVGLTTGVGLASLGHSVVGLDSNVERVQQLCAGKSPIYEPGLEDLLVQVIGSGLMTFTSDYAEAISDADFVFICVPTPQDEDGSADLSYVIEAANSASQLLKSGAIVITKSTVPVGSAQRVKQAINRPDVDVASNPEFLREGSAVYDFNKPDRIVIGADDNKVADKIAGLFSDIETVFVKTSLASAELIKYASNSFLAIKLSFVNDLAALCAATEADVHEVTRGMGLDPRIGNKFLMPGPGWGGSCLPKDTRALNALSENLGVPMPMIASAISSNERAHKRVVDLLAIALPEGLEGKTIAVWGVAFKANTDDVRESPAIAVITRLIARGAKVVVFDPIGKAPTLEGLTQVDTALSATQNAEALIVLTEWADFSRINPSEVAANLKRSVVVDTRNILDSKAWKSAGLPVTKLGTST